MSDTDDLLSSLLVQNSTLYATYQAWATAQNYFYSGSIDDPDSFDMNGLKIGPLGYYPFTPPGGSVEYRPCLERLQAGAAATALAGIGDSAGVRFVPNRLRASLLDSPYAADLTVPSWARASYNDLVSKGARLVEFPFGTIALDAPFAGADNVSIEGAGNGLGTILTALTGYPVDQPLLKPGRTATIRRLRMEYPTGMITGSETRGQRVLLSTAGSTYDLQRGSMLDELYFGRCGTAITDAGVGAFSVDFGPMEIGPHSFAGVDFYSNERSGNVWRNLYMAGGDAYNPTYGFNYAGTEFGGEIHQLNVEHQIYSDSALRLVGLTGTDVGVVHLEGIDSVNGKQYVYTERSDVEIDTLIVANTRLSSGSNIAVVRMGDAGAPTGDGTGGYNRSISRLTVNNYVTKGIATPNGPTYPSYPSGRLGIVNAPGFYHFARSSSATGTYELAVKHDNPRTYTGDIASAPAYQYIADRYVGPGVTLVEYEERKPGRNRPNMIANGNFSLGSFTSVSYSGSVNQTIVNLPGWRVNQLTGVMGMVRNRDQSMAARSEYSLAVTPSTPGTYQWVVARLPITQPVVGKQITIGIDLWGTLALLASPYTVSISQIALNLVPGTGGSSTKFQQVVGGLTITGTRTPYWWTVTIPDDSSVTWGPDAYIEIDIELNGASALRGGTLNIGDVYSVIGARPSMTDDPRVLRRALAIDETMAPLVSPTFSGTVFTITSSATAAQFALRAKSPGIANDSGLYQDASGNMEVAGRDSTGTQRFRVASNGDSYFNAGNLAIGAFSAFDKLDVTGNIRMSGSFNVGGANTVIDSNRIIYKRGYTLATKPTPTAGAEIHITNESGGYVSCFADGTSWRRCTDAAVVS